MSCSRIIISSILVSLFLVAIFSIQLSCSQTTVRKLINTPLAPLLPSAISQAVWVGDKIYVSGQVGMTLEGVLVPGIANQTRLALQYIGHILRAANSDIGNVVKTTVLLANISDSAEMTAVYAEFFTEKYPARSAYQVGHLPRDALVEIEAVAISGEIVDV